MPTPDDAPDLVNTQSEAERIKTSRGRGMGKAEPQPTKKQGSIEAGRERNKQAVRNNKRATAGSTIKQATADPKRDEGGGEGKRIATEPQPAGTMRT